MKNNTIAIAFITYSDQVGKGKTQPVLIYQQDEVHYQLFRITTKYVTKSEHIKKFYYKIREWQQAGLDHPSWIDTSTLVDFHKEWRVIKIGKLQLVDIKGLDQFLESHLNDYL
ncbi:toxin MazF [Lentilactobacillus sp. IMAU92037]|uniref:type II toxin-antitoxin system PemK/MazF family toxin n=1 Tax=Lentilactobacillus TaxID=2767893 RepID=UPI001C2C16C8|nr:MULTISPECIES: type II toxin-antitoxin system PemK/MazF family toxin [Lentilactobacillus]MBV0929388.1 toxin MazF [Lentilactobacillus dabitei]MDM7516584.1 toxin MazF [Lentilactobacillus sp. TOM.63]